MTSSGTFWIAPGTEEMHEALCLPPTFRPQTWAALLYQAADGPVGLSLVGPSAAATLSRAVCPAVGLSRDADAFVVLRCDENRGRARPFGHWLWLTVDSESTAELVEELLRTRLVESKRRALRVRYGKPVGAVQRTILDELIDRYPAVTWPIDLTGSSATHRPSCSIAWYGFHSSFGAFAVAVGLDASELADRLALAGVPEDVTVRTASHPRQLPVW